jgi:hypothetical protein
VIVETIAKLERWGGWSRGKVGPVVLRRCGSPEWQWRPPCGSTWDEDRKPRSATITDDEARRIERAVLGTGRRSAKLLVAIFVERRALEVAGARARCTDVRLELGAAIRQVDDALAGGSGRPRTGDQVQVGVVWMSGAD